MNRLRDFSYHEPTTLSEAMEILAEKGKKAMPLAGGTDLLIQMKNGIVNPAALVNIKRIKNLNKIARDKGRGLRIGALALIAEIEESPLIKSNYPVLAEAASLLGSASIRNLATIGGNVGRASPCSDMVPPLIVLGASVEIEGPSGKKVLEIEDFFIGPGRTTLKAGEVVTGIYIPKMPSRSGSAYMKLKRTEGMDLALVGTAVRLTLRGNGEAKTAKVALSSVAPTPFRSQKAEEVLMSGPLTEERLKEAARAASEDCMPIYDMRASASYRKEMVRVFIFRALEKALGLAKGGKA